MMRGKLKFFVLMALKEDDKSGYDLIKYIEDKTGYKPSPGSMYPILKSLVDDKLLKFNIKGRKKIYSLTKKGKEKVKSIHKIKDSMIKHHMEGVKLLHSFGDKDMHKFKEFTRSFSNFESPFKELNPEMINFIETLFHSMPKFKKDKKLTEYIKSEFKRLTKVLKH